MTNANVTQEPSNATKDEEIHRDDETPPGERAASRARASAFAYDHESSLKALRAQEAIVCDLVRAKTAIDDAIAIARRADAEGVRSRASATAALAAECASDMKRTTEALMRVRVKLIDFNVIDGRDLSAPYDPK